MKRIVGSNIHIYSNIIIGAGVFGLYTAWLLSKKENKKVLVIDRESDPFMRASFINQSRVHMGYHYPRSIGTALSSSRYYNRFCSEFSFCINNSFKKVYATSENFSWTNSGSFKNFCKNAGIYYEQIESNQFFRNGLVDGVFLTNESSFDSSILREFFFGELKNSTNVTFSFNKEVESIKKTSENYIVLLKGEKDEFVTDFLINATYASINQLIMLVDKEDTLPVKYELCEVILCEVSDNMKKVGITVMDGPFFSVMPFGNTGLHSLTSVIHTPHLESDSISPEFNCQNGNKRYCNRNSLGNCNLCKNKPPTNWESMLRVVKKYLKDEYILKYKTSLFTVKTILKNSELDDSRPTLVKVHTEHPKFLSILSGKINTIYDIEEYLN